MTVIVLYLTCDLIYSIEFRAFPTANRVPLCQAFLRYVDILQGIRFLSFALLQHRQQDLRDQSLSNYCEKFKRPIPYKHHFLNITRHILAFHW
jgi:hypothetical protein